MAVHSTISVGAVAFLVSTRYNCLRSPHSGVMSFAKKFQSQLSIPVMMLLLVSMKVAAQTTEPPLNESEAARGTENEICQSRILECLGLDDIDSITRENGTKANPARSCADLLRKRKDAVSGEYWVKPVSVNARYQVYCDMATFGGGWTRVEGINGQSQEHLSSHSVGMDCTGDLCVCPRTTRPITAWKLEDTVIQELANDEGTFRIDVGPHSFTTFFQLSKGPMHFHSNCEGSRCSRIITSHTYPYRWEFNCKGMLGYHVRDNKYKVFDNQDNNECEEPWKSSLYDSSRVLYGYADSTGIYPGQQGFMYVR